VPALFKALSSDYNQDLAFGAVLNENAEVAKEFKVKQWPSLLLLLRTPNGDLGDPIRYPGKITHAKIHTWIRDELDSAQVGAKKRKTEL